VAFEFLRGLFFLGWGVFGHAENYINKPSFFEKIKYNIISAT
jgi:hypothetical protein